MQPADKGQIDKPPYRLCKLYTFENNPAKTWIVEFYQWNVKTQRKERRMFTRFNNIKEPGARLKEAEKWIRFIDQQLEQGAVYNPEINKKPEQQPAPTVLPTFIQDLDTYLKHQKAVTAETSYKAYKAFVDKWKAFSKGKGYNDVVTKDITAATCQEFVDYLVQLPGIGNTTRNNTITRLQAACNHYTKPGRERWPLSPARHLEFFTASTDQHEPFTPEQAQAIFNKIEEAQDWPLLLFIYFVYYAFARPGKEVRLMRVRDLRERSVVIKSKYSKTDLVKSPTLPKPLQELLIKLMIREYNPDYYVFGVGGEPGPKPVDINHFYRKHRKILQALKLTDGYTLYSWKHTGNIKLFKADVNLKSIQQQNGHTTLKNTEIYLRKLGAFVDNEIYEKFV